jgi:RNA polymerase sigma factor (sigma-70 family)
MGLRGVGRYMSESLDAWFAREILSHEDTLIRFLVRICPGRDAVHELRQEIYRCVYEAAGHDRPTPAKAFLFTTAWQIARDRLRSEPVARIGSQWDVDALRVAIDEISSELSAGRDPDLRSLAQAFDLLPHPCREVVWMRRVEDRSQKEVAARLGIREAAVEKHVAEGMRRLADTLFSSHLCARTGTGMYMRVDEENASQQVL